MSLLGRGRVGPPLDDAQRQLLQQHIPAHQRLTAAQKEKLESATSVLIHRRRWEGCGGLTLTEEMKAVVACHAAMMLLGTRDFHFESVNSILLFPGTIRRDGHDRYTANVGEAWANGGIVLSWPEVNAIRKQRDGRNVVIHEFAHHLDGLDGEMGGSIPFNNRQDQARWDRASAEGLQQLVRDVEAGKRTVLDPYGATNRAEFFAVCSECFFELPTTMRHAHEELYELLSLFYHVDPEQWAGDL